MALYDLIKQAYPDIDDRLFIDKIILQDDKDGQGAYIAKWEYSQPIPAGLKLGKN